LIRKCTYPVFKNECSQFNVLEHFSLCTSITVGLVNTLPALFYLMLYFFKSG